MTAVFDWLDTSTAGAWLSWSAMLLVVYLLRRIVERGHRTGTVGQSADSTSATTVAPLPAFRAHIERMTDAVRVARARIHHYANFDLRHYDTIEAMLRDVERMVR